MSALEDLGKWLLFCLGVAALIPSAAALLQRRIVSVRYQVSVSVRADLERLVANLRSLPSEELLVRFKDLTKTLETYAENESNEVSNLINKVIADLDRTYRRDLLLGMVGWLISALCGMVLLIQRSELSFMLALIWCVLTAVILIRQRPGTMKTESGVEGSDIESRRKSAHQKLEK